jgi:hypothetical protein
MRVLAIIGCLAIMTAGAATRAQKRELRHNLVGKGAVARVAAGAGIAHVRNSPHQWGRGPAGLAKRVGSGFGQHVVKETIQFGVASWHHENLHYQRSNRHGTWPRMKHAVKSTFIVPRTNRRGKTVALGRISGNMGAGMVSQAWQPAAGVGAGLATGGIGLGAAVGGNVAREFWPRKHRKIVRRK